MLADLRPALDRFLDLLFEANAKFNLTAIKDRAIAWETLIEESLDLLPFPRIAAGEGARRRHRFGRRRACPAARDRARKTSSSR
jgi:hypothetical protein